jgi:hypothetical protein
MGTWVRSCDGEEYDQEEVEDIFFPFNNTFFIQSESDEDDNLFVSRHNRKMSSKYPIHMSSVYRKSETCDAVNTTKKKGEPVQSDMGTLIVYANKEAQQKYLKFTKYFSTVFKKPVDQGVCNNNDTDSNNNKKNYYVVINKDNSLSKLDHKGNIIKHFTKLVRRIMRTILQSERWNLKVRAASESEEAFSIEKYIHYDHKQKCAWLISVPGVFTLEEHSTPAKHTVRQSMETAHELTNWWYKVVEKLERTVSV